MEAGYQAGLDTRQTVLKGGVYALSSHRGCRSRTGLTQLSQVDELYVATSSGLSFGDLTMVTEQTSQVTVMVLTPGCEGLSCHL